MPLVLRLTVVRASTCRPIKGADVEIWHAAPDGEYSGFDGSSGTRYLRGHQKSDAAGRVRFDTMFPGWYRGRTPHIHLKVPSAATRSTPASCSWARGSPRAVYRTRYYASRGQADTSHAERHDLPRRRRALDAADPAAQRRSEGLRRAAGAGREDLTPAACGV